ncbi:hypothetical protein PRIPAC_91965 [Pristionchus pacificus]|uniref:Uncharacterized protein n=1 Tax=Pristionchus pacificus TaxID=54126 RepID=A0A2A6BBA9_PRIPA|nr:hypothetical protein PRIPAC_91965 [Pristionchus pacificus]|eukprot:PDM63163.1 hypothetical protein PRIPAC_50378 [Pristionchus pacificus]
MLLLFLPFLFFSLSLSEKSNPYNIKLKLNEHWECGADKFAWSKVLAELVTSVCPDAVIAHANLCCKVHDNCYDHHHQTGVSQDLCDIQFCVCLQCKDAIDKEKVKPDAWCVKVHDAACSIVQTMRNVFPDSTPPDHSKDYIKFVDYSPFSMKFRSILDACPYNQRVVVHCHNTVSKCVMEDHEYEDVYHEYKGRSFGHVMDPNQDCRATMYDCLRSVLATSHNDQCTATVLREREKVNIYKKITGDGDSINIAYPIVASRVLERCPKLWVDLKTCYKNFFECDVEQKRIRDQRYVYELRKACGNNLVYCKHPTDITEHPEYNFYDELRRINITCHKSLYYCFENIFYAKTSTVVDLCGQAFGMAWHRIRLNEYRTVLAYNQNPVIRNIFGPILDLFNID